VVPAFVGLGAPHWDASARGAIVGITRGTTRADIVRATLDSIAYQVRDVIVAMESDTGRPMSELRADGGATANRYLMQFQADILDKPVRRAKIAETTAMGAAMLAGLAIGVWKSPDDLREIVQRAQVFKPNMQSAEREQLLAGWRDAVARALTRPSD
jgi:glycerol kinase